MRKASTITIDAVLELFYELNLALDRKFPSMYSLCLPVVSVAPCGGIVLEWFKDMYNNLAIYIVPEGDGEPVVWSLFYLDKCVCEGEGGIKDCVAALLPYANLGVSPFLWSDR